jgi:hypothetical protein
MQIERSNWEYRMQLVQYSARMFRHGILHNRKTDLKSLRILECRQLNNTRIPTSTLENIMTGNTFEINYNNLNILYFTLVSAMRNSCSISRPNINRSQWIQFHYDKYHPTIRPRSFSRSAADIVQDPQLRQLVS